MGINIGICELEAESALCRGYKTNFVKALVRDTAGIEDLVEIDEYVTLEEAKGLFPEWDDFIKRNRINEEADAIYMVKVKNADDAAKLGPLVKKKFTGWVSLEGLSDEQKETVLQRSDAENRVTGWDQLDFDEMNGICAKCPLSWDKGRGCIGAFGPNNSKLPGVAAKKDCPIIASAPESSQSQKKFSVEDAKAMKKEIEILRAALPEEGKAYVRWYGGVLDRLDAVADICIKENCRFYFF